MDFLKDIALPQPLEHFRLLLFILNLLLIVFLPSLGFAAGSSVLAVRCARRGRTGRDTLQARFARDLMNTAIFSKSGMAFFLLLPALALVFVFIQLLQGTPAIAAGLMAFGFLALLAAVTLLYAFRYNLDLKQLLSSTPESAPGFQHMKESNDAGLARTGLWGTIFLLLATALCLGAISIAVNRRSWTEVGSAFDLLINADFWVRYLHFAAVSLGATGIGMLYFLFQWEGGSTAKEETYGPFVRHVAIRLAVISLIAQPLFMLCALAILPAGALTGLVFGLTGLSLSFLLLTAVILYAFHREGRTVYLGYAFCAFSIALAATFTKDQVAIANATIDHAASLSVAADRELEVLKTRMGVAPPSMSGQEIFDAKCSACHLFDQKKIGPPYREVLPKYAGKKSMLMTFVMNPVKMNPAYPNMPNQGLKPAEADSIATFLLARMAGSYVEPANPTESKKQ